MDVMNGKDGYYKNLSICYNIKNVNSERNWQIKTHQEK